MADNVRERDLVLAPNEFAFILDETKGNVIAYVGPHKTSLANTDRPVIFEEHSRRYRRCTLEESITAFPYAEEGWYIVLENPAREGDEEYAKSGPNTLVRLTLGRKVNIPGPATFPLWPGQVAQVVRGHLLRSNQYLLVQVYNEEAARENWGRAVIKPQKEEEVPRDVPDLTLGKLLLIRGTEVSFYIPPTGIEVLPDEGGNFIRDAVTLERLEYCILLDEDGNKRYIKGPDVVFPEPTERFVEKNGSRKFKAIELNEISGIYLKVIAPYTEADGTERTVGEELFLTGRDQMIYFPRPEHAIIRYGDQRSELTYAVAIPAGAASYVLNRLTGEVKLQVGPAMFLPDPRKEVIARRVLSPAECELFYPDNQQVLNYNLRLSGGEVAPAREKARVAQAMGPGRREEVAEGLVSDDFTRSQRFSPPRSVTLNVNYEGAVTIDVWTGYAVMVVSKTGTRRVVVGPQSVFLQYDETLEALQLSTGTPKRDDGVLRTAYLRVLNNKVSDVIEAETRDLCQVALTLSYRVNFEGDPERWFQVENYVKFLADHLRSLLRATIKQLGLEEFYGRAIEVVRDAILGPKQERRGRTFAENGMRVYDVDVLDVSIGDESIGQMLTDAQHQAVRQAITLADEQRELESTRKSEEIRQEIESLRFQTVRTQLELQKQRVHATLEVDQARLAAEILQESQRLQAEQEKQATLDSLLASQLARSDKQQEQEVRFQQARLEQKLAELRAEVEAVVNKAGAVSPNLVAALQSFSDQQLAGKLAESMSPLAILGGKSVADVFTQLVKGSPLANAVEKWGVNGQTQPAALADDKS
ncbi:MAG: hypothetical protein KF760_20135 [Candidatus Eremiobacteraeota bacterium]|nr:hypothetical protein [Candidatus Eremiobacteraeota bacterium]MCW5868172.1 hypothetical protein [Candidatus Eremiobacteraeota bacterium]